MSYKYISSIIAFYLLSFLYVPQTIQAQTPGITTSPKHEVRAVWLTTIGGIDWPHSYARSQNGIAKQQQELTDILDKLKKANVNTVLLQARIRATTIYPSRYEPFDGCLSGNPGISPGYDALAFAIDECHKRGMECHAWVVTIPIGKWNGAGCKALRKKMPGAIKRIGEEGYMNPENPATATYLADMCAEITDNYDIDGIHLDYIRYPETWNITIPRQQARNHITNIVKAVNKTVKARKPWVKMSCSPVGKYSDLTRYSSYGWNAYQKVCQDAQAWLRDGLMDQIYPMMYFRGNQFYPFADDWAENSYGRTVVPGLGIYFLDPKEGKWKIEDVTREMEVSRNLGMGHAYFRSHFFTENKQGIYDTASDFIDRLPALVPPMTWQSKTKPEIPHDMRVNYNNDHTSIKWQGTAPYYNLYSSDTFPVDTDAPCNLVAQRIQTNKIIIKTSSPRFYALRAMDRYGIESDAVQNYSLPKAESLLIDNNGRKIELKDKVKSLDTKYVSIETVQGCIVATSRIVNSSIDISNLRPGIYIIRSIDRNGVSHRIGCFAKRMS